MEGKESKTIEPVKVKVDGWRCTCGTVTVGLKGKPARCSNRIGCGRVFR